METPGSFPSKTLMPLVMLCALLILLPFTWINCAQDGDEASPPVERTWYRDADGDGYGSAQETTVSIAQPSGFVSDNTDCDDRAATVHPGAYEICDDRIDQDCDGQDVRFNRIGHAQGEMAGEVTARTVILQSRLTASCQAVWLDVPGSAGVASFEISNSPDFSHSFATDWIFAVPENDFIVKKKVADLQPGTLYYYRILYGPNASAIQQGPACTFRTLDEEDVAREVSFVVVTGMNYFVFHFFPGPENKHLGYPALETMYRMRPHFFVGTGDNVYYDAFPAPARDQVDLRRVWHWQFVQPRFLTLFSRVPAYWEKDDHDHRFNDSDTTRDDLRPSNELGIRTFLEQVPVVDPDDTEPVTFRTHRINKLLQIWLTEGRDYRSPNMMEDGPEKTLWGERQKAWLKETLLQSDATFKILISPTPMIGPDDLVASWTLPTQTDRLRRDNHTNPMGFRHEGDEFFVWLFENGFLEKNFYIVTGDRHWQYHSIRPDGFEEFSCGALVDANARVGPAPGDPDSNDPEGLIQQPYASIEATGGFLAVTVRPAGKGSKSSCTFDFHDEDGPVLYSATKVAR